MVSVTPPLLLRASRATALSYEPRALLAATRHNNANAKVAFQHVLGKQQPRHHVVRMASTSSANRSIHSSTTRTSAPAEHIVLDPQSSVLPSQPQPPEMAGQSPLAVLPLLAVLRSLAVTTISSSRILLPPSLAIMSILAHTTKPFLDADKNPILRFLIKQSFYAQFCAGENPQEVRQTIGRLKNIGFSGVILGYAREVVLTDEQSKDLASCGEGTAAEECIRTEIVPWAAGTMETVRLASPGDFVALKFTGAGRQALFNLSQRAPPSPALADAIDGICKLAAERGVCLLFDAEQQAVQWGIDDWTIEYMRKYNRPRASGGPAKAVIYGTYQAYLKSTASTLSEHLHIAQKEGFALGVKLVRGAYLGSDPRHLIHDTKADTDAAYDGIAEAVLRRKWSGPLASFGRPDESFPEVNMVLASHNAETVRKARTILEAGERGTEVAFAQLQGMADEVSCELLCAAKVKEGQQSSAKENAVDASNDFKPRAYKYLVWGSTGECMKYLLRRAHENRDAVQRTKSGRDAMRSEVWRRFRAVFGMA